MDLLLRKPIHGIARRLFGKICPVCGKKSFMTKGGQIWPELIAEWELSPEWADRLSRRESEGCSCCFTKARSQSLARALITYGNSPSLRELVEQPAFKALKVAEINPAGALHPYLEKLPHLTFSDYGGDPHEDLMALSYADEFFDIVITSETVEHVPDIHQALAEIRRVLKPKGAHIFTTPVIWDRKTRIRAEIKDGDVLHHLPPSYHGENAQDYLVFYEFGYDFVETCQEAGFEVEVLKHENPLLQSFIARKV